MKIEQLLLQSLELLGLGMGAVFIILILLIGLISIASRIVPEETVATTPTVAQTFVNRDHIAAITAAVHQYRKSRKL
ncbi:MAG: OadG family transporter subunit [Gammaproteobacteria bacterium]|nr:OadG family transporter subunit [Gammaproteobacteria bacterium]